MTLASPKPVTVIAPTAAGSAGRWYEDAIIYELHVRAFADSDGDGIGDFRGLTERLDYLEDLGVTTIWLLPFYPSPLRDDGYDIASYREVHPDYGTMRDFRRFLRAAHARGLRVITELVLNHTSDMHEWFQRARRAAPGSRARNFYVWSDSPDKYRGVRIIFQDFETSNWTWDPVAGAYYWHRFYSHQPDLNWDNPEVQRAMFSVVDFWLAMGVDGLRLDAVPYLFEREGTNCENLPETHGALRALRRHMDEKFPDRMLLAEANQWPEDAVAYFGEGDECNMAYHFPLMPRMFMAVRMEDRYPLVDILAQTPPIPDGCQWAIFLRNHDELTLEMVTDEERDYMYRAYADDPQARINLGIRRRLAPLLGNDRRVIELVNALLLSLPGTPVIYYGDELGMGDNIYLGDRNGVRTPMQWSLDRNGGFSRANPQQLYLPVVSDPEYGAVNVESQQANPNSLLWWMKRLLALRKRYQAFGRGSLEFLLPENRKVLSYLREYGEERILVVCNLSRRAQYVELDLRRFEGHVPEELLGHSQFPAISGDRPYPLALGPHDFYLFVLHPAPPDGFAAGGPCPEIRVQGRWPAIFDRRTRRQLDDAVAQFLPSRRWFAGKSRGIRRVVLVDAVRVPGPGRREAGYLCLLRVEYREGEPDTYVLPLVARSPVENGRSPAAATIAMMETQDGRMALLDGADDPVLAAALLQMLRRGRRIGGLVGSLATTRTRELRKIVADGDGLEPQPLGAEQSNSSVAFGQRAVLKLFRRVEPGPNPEAEVTAALTRSGFAHVSPAAGTIEYHRRRRQPVTIGLLQGFVTNEGDAWEYTMDEVTRYLEDALARDDRDVSVPGARLVDLAAEEIPAEVADSIGSYLEFARLLGERTAQMHVALTAADDGADFAPETFTALQQRAQYQSLRNLIRQVLAAARRAGDGVAELEWIAPGDQPVLARVRGLLDGMLEGSRIRVHGDYHLGQVLWTGRDVVIIDFEGEPARPLAQRRLKRSPAYDVAGMLRSFHYAAYAALFRESGRNDAVGGAAEAWAKHWRAWVSAAFLKAYLAAVAPAAILPEDPDQLARLIDLHLIEKAVYELGYELDNRPDWVVIPARGLEELLGA
ncbi:MAG TPA: maltose alpha-D-glucosyltransferase [Gaiellales bacterium]|nr:maltose alpha-D-glucosyltransferase [Gaiellales bacterium]